MNSNLENFIFFLKPQQLLTQNACKGIMAEKEYGNGIMERFNMGILAAFMVPHPPLIVPEVGRGEEKKIQNTVNAYEKVARRIGEIMPETLVVISPHQIMYADYFHISPGKSARGNFGQFRAAGVQIEADYDMAFVKKLCSQADACGLPTGTEGERDPRLDHGTMVPLYFINKYWTGYRLVRIGLSGMPLKMHYELGKCIQDTAAALDRKAVIIASGDLSHRLKPDGPYGYQKEGPEYDKRVMEVMEKGEFLELLRFSKDFCSKAGECGHRSFTMMAGALRQKEITARRLSYEGSFGVGYGVCAYEVRPAGA